MGTGQVPPRLSSLVSDHPLPDGGPLECAHPVSSCPGALARTRCPLLGQGPAGRAPLKRFLAEPPGPPPPPALPPSLFFFSFREAATTADLRFQKCVQISVRRRREVSRTKDAAPGATTWRSIGFLPGTQPGLTLIAYTQIHF